MIIAWKARCRAGLERRALSPASSTATPRGAGRRRSPRRSREPGALGVGRGPNPVAGRPPRAVQGGGDGGRPGWPDRTGRRQHRRAPVDRAGDVDSTDRGTVRGTHAGLGEHRRALVQLHRDAARQRDADDLLRRDRGHLRHRIPSATSSSPARQPVRAVTPSARKLRVDAGRGPRSARRGRVGVEGGPGGALHPGEPRTDRAGAERARAVGSAAAPAARMDQLRPGQALGHQGRARGA